MMTCDVVWGVPRLVCIRHLALMSDKFFFTIFLISIHHNFVFGFNQMQYSIAGS